MIRLLSALAVAGLFLLAADPAAAQQQRSNNGGLPSWAAPSGGQSAAPSMNSTTRAPTIAAPETKAPGDPAPPPPEPPPQVPVDGGLVLLAAAGAGYAVRKLRSDDGNDEDATV